MCRIRRTAFTLVECLVVILIVGILLGLLLAGIMRVRESGLRMESTNNLKQIILAVHHFNQDHQQHLPTIDGKKPNTGLSLHAAILPYIEQGNALNQLAANPSQFLLIRTYLSPADPSFQKSVSDRPEASSYGANARVFINEPRFPVSIPDGTSNTIGFGEHYSYCGIYYFGTFVNSPGLGNWPHRATFADVLDLGPQTPPPPVTFQVAPSNADCNPALAQTPHPGGMLAAIMDGSVRQLSPGISPLTYWGAVTPDGGEELDNW